MFGRLISFRSVGAARLSDSVPNEWISLLTDHGDARYVKLYFKRLGKDGNGSFGMALAEIEVHER